MRLGAQAPRLAVGLVRVSTAEQGQSGLGLEAQQASIRSFVTAQGWTLVAEYSDVVSGKDDRRPGFQSALARCRQFDAVLVAARLDRITRRAHTLSQLLEDGVSIRAADMPGASDLMLRIYATMTQKERELIGERTRAALAAAKARRKVLGGDRGYQKLLDEGRYASITDMAAAERIERGYLGSLLRLTLLAPDIVEAILNGTLAEVTLPRLLEPFDVPWHRQWVTTADGSGRGMHINVAVTSVD